MRTMSSVIRIRSFCCRNILPLHEGSVVLRFLFVFPQRLNAGGGGSRSEVSMLWNGRTIDLCQTEFSMLIR